MTNTGIENGDQATAPVVGVAGERGVVAVSTDATALRSVGEAVVGDGSAVRAAVHTPLDPESGSPAAVLRCVGDTTRLIEACGLKGLERGGARVSERHANFIVNPRGTACAADIEWLIGTVRTRVLERTGVDLHPEVRIVGEAA